MSVAFCAAMPRCLSSSTGSSFTRRARINALGVREVDRADQEHFHRGMARRRSGNHDHGGNPPKARKREPLDHLLIGDDLVGAGRELPIDAVDAEWMPELNRFPSRARGHSDGPTFPRTTDSGFSDIGGACALSRQLAIVFSATTAF